MRKFNGIPKAHFELYLKECELRFNTPSAKYKLTVILNNAPNAKQKLTAILNNTPSAKQQ